MGLYCMKQIMQVYSAGLTLDILKMASLAHMGRTANIIIKDMIHIFCVHKQNHAYFADGTA